MRTYYTWRLTESTDISWNVALMGMWTWIEMSFGVVVASLPVTPRFYQFCKQKASKLATNSRERGSRLTGSHNIKGASKVASISLASSGHAKSSEPGAYYELESPRKAAFPYKVREASAFDDEVSHKGLVG